MEIKIEYYEPGNPTYGGVEIVGRDIFCEWEIHDKVIILDNFVRFDRDYDRDIPITFRDDDPIRAEIIAAVQEWIDRNEAMADLAAEMVIEDYRERRLAEGIDDGR